MNQLKKLKESLKKMITEDDEAKDIEEVREEPGSQNLNQNPKLEEIPILIPKNHLRWSPISTKLKWLQKSMRDLAMNLMLEPTKEQSHLWLNKKMQNEWRLKQNQNQPLNQSRSAMIAYLSSKQVEDEPVFEQPEQEEVSLSFDEQTEVVADVTFESDPVFDEPEPAV